MSFPVGRASARALALLVAVSIGNLYSTQCSAESDDDWQFMVSPLFLWGMSIDGTTAIEGTVAEMDLDFSDDLLENMEAAFTVHFEARKQDLVLFAEYQYVNLQPSADVSFGPVAVKADIDFTVQSSELGAGYTVSQSDRTRWEVLGGLRWTDHDIKVDIEGPAFLPNKINAGDDWTHGFLGGRMTSMLSDNWSFLVRGDVGYGGSDNKAVHVNAVFDYRFRGWGSAFAGYRYMDFDYDGGAYAYDAKQQGPMIGLSFYW